ncbi:MAG: putative pyridoxal kinase [Bathelium mastoideum]|nr:MAG: putative pyridoxal kinase [Bathelium mastoideum]
MTSKPVVPETRVLAIASHVVHGYVGNTMASFVMQSLGCEVSAINTVNFSNHTAYKQVKGRKTPAEEITELYQGLKQSHLTDFDVMLSGYIPNAEAVEAVGKIGRDLKFEASTKPGSFFWVLDPVMGDNGRLYVSEDVVPAYKNVINQADMILPNQFEAELLSGVKITDISSIVEAVTVLHKAYLIPHVVITSLQLDPETGKITPDCQTLTVVGSTARKDHTPRLFQITVPALPLFFSGTGDMLAALLVARFRAAIAAASLAHTPRWQSPNDVAPLALPLADAASRVLASMHAVLRATRIARDAEVAELEKREQTMKEPGGEEEKERMDRDRWLGRTKAAEVRVVRHVQELREPPEVERFRAEELRVGWRGEGVEGAREDDGTALGE